MNEELKNQMEMFISKALDIVEKGIDTAGEQIPLILQEIVYWQIGKNSIALLIAFIICLIAFVSGYKLLKHFGRKNNEDGCAVGVVLIIASILIFFTFFLTTGMNIVQAIVAPRLVILDYLKGML